MRLRFVGFSETFVVNTSPTSRSLRIRFKPSCAARGTVSRLDCFVSVAYRDRNCSRKDNRKMLPVNLCGRYIDRLRDAAGENATGLNAMEYKKNATG